MQREALSPSFFFPTILNRTDSNATAQFDFDPLAHSQESYEDDEAISYEDDEAYEDEAHELLRCSLPPPHKPDKVHQA